MQSLQTSVFKSYDTSDGGPTLPAAKLGSEESVWTHTGVDVFGPILMKQRRSRIKRWVIIFVSLPIRAVHLEPLLSLSTDSMLCSFLRFDERRGKAVKHLYCDSGSNFIGAEREIKKLLLDLKFREGLNSQSGSLVEWHFNVPKAFHMGGSWEIQIKAAN